MVESLAIVSFLGQEIPMRVLFPTVFTIIMVSVYLEVLCCGLGASLGPLEQLPLGYNLP